nr:MAK10-like protein [Tanacetum cinerariifolium]
MGCEFYELADKPPEGYKVYYTTGPLALQLLTAGKNGPWTCSLEKLQNQPLNIFCPSKIDNTNPQPEVPPSILIEKVLKLNSILESLNLKPQSSYSGVVCKKEIDSDVMLIELIKDDEHPSDDELNKDDDVGEEEFEENHFDKFSTCGKLAYHKYLMHDPHLSKIVRDPIIKRGNPSNLKIPCNIGHVHIERADIDLDSPLNIRSRSCYNWVMTARLAPRKNPSGLNNFTGRAKGMHIFVRNFTYVSGL